MTVKPLFPVISVTLGSAKTVTNSKLPNGKPNKSETETFYYGVFTIKTPNKMFLLTSTSGDDITIPKLEELLKRPHITLNGLTFDIDLPKTVHQALLEMFSAPLNELDGVSPYLLASYGMIDYALFSDTIKRILAPSLMAQGLEFSDLDNNRIMKQVHLTRAVALGSNGDYTPMGERLQTYLNELQGQKKLMQQKNNSVYVTDKQTVITVSQPTEPLIREHQPTENQPTETVVGFYDDANRYKSMSFKQLKKEMQDKGLTLPANPSKASLSAILWENDLTTPEAPTGTANV